MAEAILDLRLDTVQPNRVRLVYGVQNDYNSRFLAVRFTVNGKPIDIESTAAVRINAKRPDGNKDAFPGTVNTDGTAKVPVAQWMLEAPGEVSASITAVTTGGALTTQEFYIMAKASIWDSTGEPSAENPDKDVLQTIIASENERVAAESTRVANENARKSAETARATAETKRIADEATRVVNEAGRVSAEEIRREEFATWQDEWGKISSFDKRIENLEAAVSPGMVTPTIDDTIAYRKTVPNGVLPNAAVCEVGGMSYKCENLAKPSISRQWLSTASIADDGKITITCNAVGTAFCIAYSCAVKAGETYYVKLHNVSGISRVVFFGDAYANTGSLKGFTSEGVYTATSDATIYIGIYLHDNVASGTVGSCYVMLNKGSTALPYQPYFTGLRDSKVTAIESVGANLLNMNALDNKTTNGITFTKNSDGTYTANGTATAHVQVWLATIAVNNNESLWLSGGGDGVQITVNGMNNGNFVQNIGTVNGNTMKLVQGVTYNKIEVYLVITNGKTLSNYTFYGMLNKGSTALPYTPYFREALPVPSDALDGWGQGVNAQCYNKIVLDPAEGVKKHVKKVGAVDLGAVSWNRHTPTQPRIWCSFRDIGKLKTSTIGLSPIRVIGNFPTFDSYNGEAIGLINDGTVYLKSPNFEGKTIDEIKTYLTGTMLLIELATPVETDVSHLFTDDNLLPVVPGGTITAVNEYEQAVPFSIEYTVKGA